MQKACHLLCYVTTVPACGYMMADSFHEGLRPHINGVISLQRAVQAADQVFAARSLVINLECKKTGAGSTWRTYGTVCLSRYGVWASVHIAWMTWSRGLESKLMPVLRIWHRLSDGGLASWQLLTNSFGKAAATNLILAFESGGDGLFTMGEWWVFKCYIEKYM